MYYCTDCREITEGTTETEIVLESIPGIQRGASQEIVKCSNCGSMTLKMLSVVRPAVSGLKTPAKITAKHAEALHT